MRLVEKPSNDNQYITMLDRMRDLMLDINGTNEGSEEQAAIVHELGVLGIIAASQHPTFVPAVP